ncbi:DNA adenine methylase [Sphingomonas arantia]|uniref:site-specific DNA-methyltransferase (adenine-specific) n=1 Tax=Sphingomonas arantia TaxID=1460676 RepID=A0ABW4TZF3_9SPHN
MYPTIEVRPVRPVAPYLGGKRNLAGRLCKMIDAIPCQTYVEPFVGMGGIFLRRSRRPAAEVINDLSGDVANLFLVLQEHYPFLMDILRWRLTSRVEFERLLALPADRLTDLHRAARFLYLQRLAFGGKIEGRAFGVSPATPGRFDISKLEPMLAELHERLSGVVIERLPYDQIILRYDAPGTLFYLDPPYWGCESDYGPDSFSRAEFGRMAELLTSVEGRFILSLNDTPEVRATFAAFSIDEIETTWSISSPTPAGATRVTELVISGGRAPLPATNLLL